MTLITTEERLEALKNLLADPNDWISYEILRLADEEEIEPYDSPMGINESSPEARKSSSKAK